MPSKTQSILLGGLIVGILSTSWLGMSAMLCCANVWIGALVAVWHYTSENRLTITAGQGALIGVLAGLVGALIAFVLNYVLSLVGLPDSVAMGETINGFFRGMVPADQAAQMEEQMAEQMEFQRSFTGRLIGLGSGLLVGAIFGAIGGAIGGAIFKKADPNQPGAAESTIY